MAKPKRKKEKQPTFFVLDGAIMCYEDGSMLELHGQVNTEEWEQIIEETVKYKVFVECLKETGMPLLEERWEDQDDYFRVQLDVAVSRMRNIDPLLVAKWNQEELKEEYTKQMKSGAIEVGAVVTKVKEMQKQALLDGYDGDATQVSDL